MLNSGKKNCALRDQKIKVEIKKAGLGDHETGLNLPLPVCEEPVQSQFVSIFCLTFRVCDMPSVFGWVGRF
jgi:hypothetical protein